MIPSSKWILNSVDVKTAFLHGKAIERTVYVRSLKKPIQVKYGNCRNVYMASQMQASIVWYLKLKEDLMKLGALPSTLDDGIFICDKEHKAIGIVACFVDNLL